MADKFRIMVEGEDHSIFCYKSNVAERTLQSNVEKAQDVYPCGKVWTENETKEREDFLKGYDYY